MREILFRGLTRNGVWTEGNLLDYPAVNRAYIRAGEYFRIGCTTEVARETVGQYTGLNDKNGKKIFEGDIMTFNAYGIDYVGVVEYAKDSFGVSCNGASPYLHAAAHTYNGEIVGNIHDNPELLGGADNDE